MLYGKFIAHIKIGEIQKFTAVRKPESLIKHPSKVVLCFSPTVNMFVKITVTAELKSK